MSVVFAPEVAVAIERCMSARTLYPNARSPRHPRPCTWCDYPIEELCRMVEGFNAWAGWDPKANTYGRHEVRVFSELKRDAQEALIVAAQSLVAPTPVPESVAPTPPPLTRAVIRRRPQVETGRSDQGVTKSPDRPASSTGALASLSPEPDPQPEEAPSWMS